jgi:hypothetical protein
VTRLDFPIASAIVGARARPRQRTPTEVYGINALTSSGVTSRANIWVDVLKSIAAYNFATCSCKEGLWRRFSCTPAWSISSTTRKSARRAPAPHHDGDDVWRAIETMQRHGLPREDQAKFLVANARRLYKVQAPANIIRDRVTEIERTDWWPTDEEVRAALRPEAAVTRG